MINLTVAGVVTTNPTIDQYPLTGPVATTAKVRDVVDAASMQNADISQLEYSASTEQFKAEIAAITGIGINIDVYA